MKEKRQHKRIHLIFYLRVFNDHNGELLGYLVDISENGIRLTSEVPINVGECFKLNMAVDSTKPAQGSLSFEAYSRWSQPNPATRFYDTGFELKKLSKKKIKSIKKIIDELGLTN